jgi:hypothetical protein
VMAHGYLTLAGTAKGESFFFAMEK